MEYLAESEYIDDYRSCKRTYLTLAVQGEKKLVSKILNSGPISPTRTNYNSKGSRWFFTTQDMCDSKDYRRHLFIFFDVFDKNENFFYELKSNSDLQLCCFWESDTGNGGPIIDHKTSFLLSKFGLDLDFDIWV